ncbi:MAG: hypothetical protein ACRESS_04220 [Stenotrophobium sp.]
MTTQIAHQKHLQRTQSASPDRRGGLAFCSIATPSHVPQAVACLQSIHRYHEDARYFLLLVNAEGQQVSSLPDTTEALSIEDCVGADDLRMMRKRYSITELCFAVKPFLIATLLEAGMDQVHYLDSDCLAFNCMTPLVLDLANADLLLTPHCLSPVPEDGQSPSALTLLKAGTFNAGYISVRRTGQGADFVAWLSSMTIRYAKNAPKEGMCGDQRWLDLTPALFPGMAICRHPGANVAYWNLHERKVLRDSEGHFRVNDQALIFFHFSGHVATHPTQLSKHQNRHPLIPGSHLHELVEFYRSHLPSDSERTPGKQRYLPTVLGRMTRLQSAVSRNPHEKKK